MENASLSFDKRKHPRITVTIQIKYKVINQSEEAVSIMEQKKVIQDGKADNVSAEGLFLVSEKILENGDILKLEVTLPGEPQPLRAFSEVVWISDYGLPEGKHGAGIYFMALRDEDADKIGRFVAEVLKVERPTSEE
ncbi:PilZ domain-containing protein [bacterium]|nr:PilZ domain-containing protein [bacterium]